MLLVEILLPGACELHLGFVLKLVLWGDCVPQHAGRVRIRVRVRVRVRGGGDYFLRLHTPVSKAGLAR